MSQEKTPEEERMEKLMELQNRLRELTEERKAAWRRKGRPLPENTPPTPPQRPGPEAPIQADGEGPSAPASPAAAAASESVPAAAASQVPPTTWKTAPVPPAPVQGAERAAAAASVARPVGEPARFYQFWSGRARLLGAGGFFAVLALSGGATLVQLGKLDVRWLDDGSLPAATSGARSQNVETPATGIKARQSGDHAIGASGAGGGATGSGAEGAGLLGPIGPALPSADSLPQDLQEEETGAHSSAEETVAGDPVSRNPTTAIQPVAASDVPHLGAPRTEPEPAQLIPRVQTPARPSGIDSVATPTVAEPGVGRDLTVPLAGLESNAIEELPPPRTDRSVEDRPSFVSYTNAPVLQNRDEVLRQLERQYPEQLRQAGITGSVVLWLYIDEEGQVQRSVVAESSGYELMDQAAHAVAETMRWKPAMNRDKTTAVWLAQAIDFE